MSCNFDASCVIFRKINYTVYWDIIQTVLATCLVSWFFFLSQLFHFCSLRFRRCWLTQILDCLNNKVKWWQTAVGLSSNIKYGEFFYTHLFLHVSVVHVFWCDSEMLLLRKCWLYTSVYLLKKVLHCVIYDRKILMLWIQLQFLDWGLFKIDSCEWLHSSSNPKLPSSV